MRALAVLTAVLIVVTIYGLTQLAFYIAKRRQANKLKRASKDIKEYEKQITDYQNQSTKNK